MVYITGDMHGDIERLYDKEFRKLKRGDILIVCGDFGYIFNGSKQEKQVVNYFAKRKFVTAFVEGTHDNLDIINRCRETVWKGGRVHRIKGNLLHLMRGQIFDIEGNRFFTFGGGESADKDMRVAEGDCRVDYIITHEPPSRVKSAMLLRRGGNDSVNKLNGYLEEIGRSCSYRHWYFGSLHEDRVITEHHTCVFKKLLPIESNSKNL